MKNAIAILSILLLLSSCANSQKEAITYHPIVQKAKETSLYSNKVDWAQVNAKFIALTKGEETVEAQKEGLQYLINSLGDKHAQIRSVKDYSAIVFYTGEREADARESEFINTVINDVSAKFSYQLLDNKVGYLRVVGIGPGNVKEQSDFIRAGLVNLKAEGVDKWIVDLRYNGGGNMEPMVSGLAPLIGEGYIGGAVNGQNEVTQVYKIENGQFNNYNRIACPMDNLPKIDSTEKVAVLLSRYTISSGEMLAIAFKGRANTKFIGEATAGYTTGNGFDPVNDEIALVISQDVFMDRNKVVYHGTVGVDETIEFGHMTDLVDDLQLERALEWLGE